MRRLLAIAYYIAVPTSLVFDATVVHLILKGI